MCFETHAPATVEECIPQASQPVLLNPLASLMLEWFSANLSPAAASSGEADIGSQWLGLFAQRTIEERRVSASTLEAYTLDMAALSRWAVAQKKDLLCLSAGDLTRYLKERLEQGAHPSTLARHLSSCRRFYAFLINEGALAANPAATVPAPQVTRHEPRRVPDDVLGKMLRPRLCPEASPASAYRARRDHTIVCMLYGTSLGISDIRLLRWPQIDEQRHVIRVRHRNGEVRSFVLDARLLATLKALRGCVATASLDQGDSSYCFPTASGMPMTRQALCQVVRKWAQDCGWEEVITPSALRQSGRAHQAQQRVARDSAPTPLAAANGDSCRIAFTAP